MTELLRLSAATLAVVAAGLVSSSVVTLALLLAIWLAGEVSLEATTGAALLIVGWLTVLLEIVRHYSSSGRPPFTERQGHVLAVLWIAALLTGLVFRKVLLFWRPSVFPPMAAYGVLLVPAVPLLLAWWHVHGRKAYAQLTANDANIGSESAQRKGRQLEERRVLKPPN